ncbi:hypothetical protein [Streptomyces sp. NPDC058644]|uniref:hypothetical protein n=1 Tax=unclassified Streptomyces TaxID=2593676 RepID=UPI003646DAFD
MAVPTASATPSTAQACTYSTISQFPGSWVGYRYGQVDVSFALCGTDPAGWNATVTKSQTNSTGNNLGFFIDSSSVFPVASSDRDKTFRLQINHKSCVPRVGYPCYGTGSMTKDYYIDLERTQPVIWPRPANVPDPSLRLYDTP